MFVNQSAIKINKKKPKTISKSIKQYEFSSTQPKKKRTKQKDISLKTMPNENTKTRTKQNQSNIIVIQDQINPIPLNCNHISVESQTQFENKLIDDLDQLLKKLEMDILIIKNDLNNFIHIDDTQSEIKAFQECVNLLSFEFSQDQIAHQTKTNVVLKKILQVDDYKKRVMKQIKQKKQQNDEIKKQYQQLQQQHKTKIKQQHNKKAVRQKIVQQSQNIKKNKNFISSYKQKSYLQKQQFIQLQNSQLKIQKQLNILQYQYKKYHQNQLFYQKYQQLLKIKQKVIISRDNTEDQIRPHLQRKIQKMSKLRSQLKNIDDVMETCKLKIQDQNIVIDALKQKSYNQQILYNVDKKNEDLYELYKKRYNEIYFGKQSQTSYNTSNDWQTYNTYLKQLINRNRRHHSRVYTEVPKQQLRSQQISLTNSKLQLFYRQKNKLNTLPLYSDDIFLGQNKYFNQQFKNQSIQKYFHHRLSQKKYLTKLPRVSKINGKISQNSIKHKRKQQIIKQNGKSSIQSKDGLKITNESLTNIQKNSKINTQHNNQKKLSDYQQESRNSMVSKQSGQIIQIEFHKK